MSLSPLYPNHTMDLHVTTATVLHQSFLRLQPAQAKFTIFRVLTSMLYFSTFHKRPNDAAGMRLGTKSLSVRPLVSITKKLAYEVDSLVRVSRRVREHHPNPARGFTVGSGQIDPKKTDFAVC